MKLDVVALRQDINIHLIRHCPQVIRVQTLYYKVCGSFFARLKCYFNLLNEESYDVTETDMQHKKILSLNVKYNYISANSLSVVINTN